MIPPADIEQRLHDLVDGELAPAEREEVLALVASDASLQAQLDEIRAQDRMLAAFLSERSDRIARGSRPDLAGAAAEIAPAGRRPGWMTWTMAAAAALLLAAGLSSLASWGREDPRAGRVVATTGRGPSALAPDDPVSGRQTLRTPAGGHLEVALASGGSFELNANTLAKLADGGSAIELHRGEVLVRALGASGQPIVVTTPQLVVEGRDAVFGVVRGVRGAEVAVVSGRVEVKQAGARLELAAGQSHSSERIAPVPVRDRIAWSSHREQLMAALAPAIEPAATPAAATPGAHVALFELAVTTEFLPTRTLFLVEAPSLAYLLEPLGARTVADLLDPVRILPQLEQARLSGEVDIDEEAIEAIRYALESPEFAAIAPALEDSISLAVTPTGPVLVADVRGHESAINRALDANLRPILREHGLDAKVRVEAANGFLAAGLAGEDFDETWQALQRVAATGFTRTPFVGDLREAAPDSLITAALNARGISGLVRASQGADSRAMRNLRRAGFDRLGTVLAASDFGDQAGNQALRMVFDEQRSGVLGWLGEAGPMGSLQFFSPSANFLFAMKIESPGAMLSSIRDWLAEDGLAVRGPETDAELLVAQRILDTLGNEVALGLDMPLLPTPNLKIAIEVLDPEGFHDGMLELIDLLYASDTPAGQTLAVASDYRGRLIVEFQHPALPVGISYAVIDDFVVFGAGRAFTQRTIDLAEESRGIDREHAFLSSLPARSGTHVSLLMYQRIGEQMRQAAPFIAQLAPRNLLDALDLSPGDFAPGRAGEPQGPTVAYAVAEANRIDFFVEGRKVGGLPLGRMPAGLAAGAAEARD